MNLPFPDAMVIQASGFGSAMTAQQSIQRARKVVLDLEAISPWRRPFSVSGCTEETDNMPIATDLSDFDEVVMRALQSYSDTRYYNESDPSDWRLSANSLSPYGFRESFSDIHGEKSYWNSIVLSLRSAAMDNLISREDALYVIKIPDFKQGQVNAAWSESAAVQRIFDYFIDTYNPMKCVVFGSYQSYQLLTPKNDNYTIGWLNYTRNAKVADVFAKTGKAIPHRAGVLLNLGEEVSVLSDPKIDAELAEISNMLWSAGVRR